MKQIIKQELELPNETIITDIQIGGKKFNVKVTNREWFGHTDREPDALEITILAKDKSCGYKLQIADTMTGSKFDTVCLKRWHCDGGDEWGGHGCSWENLYKGKIKYEHFPVFPQIEGE